MITGIGFLGAGAIIRDKESIKGLTTAASIWVVSGLGLAVGTGFIRTAIYTTVLVLIVLHLLRYLDSLIFKVQKPKDNKEDSDGLS